MAKGCLHCGKEIESYVNYCSGSECIIGYAKSQGGVAYLPNGLPIASIRADCNMFEHEHGDHPTYLFPVEVQFVGKKPEGLEDWDCSYENQTHALIYTDGGVAVTMYEANYAMWKIGTGELLGSRYHTKEEWRLNLTEAMIEEKIANRVRTEGNLKALGVF